MSLSPPPLDGVKPKIRPVGATELSWCKAAPGGTGITVLALLFSKPPNTQILQNALHKLQNSHPILNSKLRYHPASNSFSFITPSKPHLQIQPFDLQSTAQILQTNFPDDHTPPFQLILEHELNTNAWQNPDPSSDTDVSFASLYTLDNSKWVLALRHHTSACDRTSIAALLSGVVGVEWEDGGEMEGSLGIEDCVPRAAGSKWLWARGFDMLGYSLNSFRTANLEFKDTVSDRMSRVVRLQMNSDHTARILSSCNENEIKLSGILKAAVIMASHCMNGIPNDEWRKYAITTLIDCRPILDPVLPTHHVGFYHSAILHNHDYNGQGNLWDLAKQIHSFFMNAKNNKKHFTDMSDLNFLMCKAIENPSLTPSSSLRTSLVSVFEDPMIMDHPNEDIGLEDFIGCTSVHGVGPSIAIFDTIRDGKLDCACVFPFPLHSRQQMQDLIDEMKRLLLDGLS